MNHDEHLDHLLDEALNEYRDAEPLAGMEDRVLRRLGVQPAVRRNMWWKWALVATCALVLVFAAWLGFRGHAPQRPVAGQATETSIANIPPEAKPAAETPHAATTRHSPLPHKNTQIQIARSAAPHTQVARLDDSARGSRHLPVPLTGEERQLLALAQAHPDALRAISQEDRPITITPLTIQPLPSEANPNGDN